MPALGLATDLAMALDPVRLAERAGITPDPWQVQALRSMSPRQLFNVHRQGGKSTVAAVKACHAALYQPGSLVLMLSPSLRQSGELFRKAVGLYHALGRPVAAASETALSLTLANGSRIVSLPGSEATVRGFSAVNLLIVDEASRVADGLYYSIRPMLAVSGGSLLALSTPFGNRGWWHAAWTSEEPWERFEVPAEACPRIPASFLEEERRSMGQWWFDQEYLCRFADAQDSVFRYDDIVAALTLEVRPLFPFPGGTA